MEFLNDILAYSYLSNAVIACILSGITCGIVGTYIVSRRMVFLCGGITHASFGGMGIAFYLGANPIAGAMIFAILSSLGIEFVGQKTRIREDSAIGLVWGVGMAIGAFFMSLRPGYTSGDMATFLFGSIVTVTRIDVIMLALLTLFLIITAAIWMRPIMYISFDRDFSDSAGILTRVVGYVMAVVTAMTIVLSIRVMGIVLLISLLTMPVVMVNFITKSYTSIAIWSAVVAVLSSLSGLVVSYYAEVPSGPAIIFVLAAMMFVAKLLSLCRNKLSTK